MSYDIALTVQTGPAPESYVDAYWANYTSNMSPAWRAAGIDFAEWDGKAAAAMAPVLRDALIELESNAEKYKQYDPDNGWGSYETLLPFMRDLLSACQTHPLTTVRVSR